MSHLGLPKARPPAGGAAKHTYCLGCQDAEDGEQGTRDSREKNSVGGCFRWRICSWSFSGGYSRCLGVDCVVCGCLDVGSTT